jgi:hypothetical protein
VYIPQSSACGKTAACPSMSDRAIREGQAAGMLYPNSVKESEVSDKQIYLTIKIAIRQAQTKLLSFVLTLLPLFLFLSHSLVTVFSQFVDFWEYFMIFLRFSETGI